MGMQSYGTHQIPELMAEGENQFRVVLPGSELEPLRLGPVLSHA